MWALIFSTLFALACAQQHGFFFGSSDFHTFGVIPTIHACATADYYPYGYGGQSVSPELHWSDAPEQAKSVVIVMHDSDAEPVIGFSYLHWLVTDLPIEGELKQNASANGLGEVYPYVGMCPPDSATHLYRFTAFLRSVETTTLDISEDAEKVLTQLLVSSILI
jgi:Raf kinase inhibitor-like YbhB/YbcL family protein